MSRSIARAITVSAPTDRRVRVVSLNCANTARCVEDLVRVQPDIVLLQESPGIDGLQRMTQQLFGDAGHFLSGGDTAILARGTIEGRFVDLAGHFVVGTITLPGEEPIQCVSLRLTPPVARLDFWTTGFWLEHREMRNLHRRELQEVVQEIRRTDATSQWVVGGDFNTTPHDRALSELRPMMADSFSQSGTGLGGTGTNDWPLFRVDQVWVNSHCETERVCAVKSIHSDHRLVVCDLQGEDAVDSRAGDR